MNDNLTLPKRPIDEVDASLKELLEDVKSLKSDVSYIKHNIKRFLKEKENKEIVQQFIKNPIGSLSLWKDVKTLKFMALL